MATKATNTAGSIPSLIDVAAAMNMVTFSAEQIQTAMEILALLPIHDQADPIAQGLALQAYASEAAIGRAYGDLCPACSSHCTRQMDRSA